MDNSDPLVYYGIALIVVMAGFVLIPYLRGKSELMTSWNVLLTGIAMFAGFGGLEVRYGEFTWPKLQWFQPTRYEVQYYMGVTTAFTVVLLLCQYYDPIGRAITRRALQKWPPINGLLCAYVLVFCGLCTAGSVVTSRLLFWGPVFVNLGQKAVVFATVFSFMMWYRRPANIVLLGLFIGIFLAASFYSMLVYVGRRLLLSVFLGPVLYLYWSRMRLWKPRYCLAAMSFAATLIVIVGIAYSSFRFYSRGRYGEERTTKSVMDQLAHLETQNVAQTFYSNKLHYISQWSAHYALLLTRLVDSGVIEPKPLNTLRFLIAFPIPHKIWEDKPEVIGLTIVRDWMQDTTTNWGVGIAGHCAYEGGVLAIALYAFLLSILIRFMDDPMQLQPTNPFLISTLAAAMPHVMGIPRGDFGIMTINVIECILFMMLVAVGGRLLFGTERRPQQKFAYPSHAGIGYGLPGQSPLSGRPNR